MIKYDEALAAGYKTIEAYESFKLEQKQQQIQPEQALSEADIASSSETVIEESSELNAHRAEEDYQSDADSIDFEEKEDELPYIATDEELEGL